MQFGNFKLQKLVVRKSRTKPGVRYLYIWWKFMGKILTWRQKAFSIYMMKMYTQNKRFTWKFGISSTVLTTIYIYIYNKWMDSANEM